MLARLLSVWTSAAEIAKHAKCAKKIALFRSFFLGALGGLGALRDELNEESVGFEAELKWGYVISSTRISRRNPRMSCISSLRSRYRVIVPAAKGMRNISSVV